MPKYEGKINVVGVEYRLYTYSDYKEINDRYVDWHKQYNINGREIDNDLCDGYCNYVTKEIHIYFDGNYSEEYKDQILRHELTHVFLYEISYAHFSDEEFIDKISKWVPQIEKAFKQGKELLEDDRIKEESSCEKDCKECISNGE